MIDYLHGCNQPSRTLAGALAHLIMISIRIPMNAKQTYLALANLLCVSNDSFIFDFVLVCLGTRKTLGLSSSFSKRITKYIFFLRSNSPEYKEKKKFIDNLILSFKKFNEVDSTMFRCLLENMMYQIERIEIEFVMTPYLLSSNEHTLENRAVGNRSVLGYDPSIDYDDVYGKDQKVVITPTNASTIMSVNIDPITFFKRRVLKSL